MTYLFLQMLLYLLVAMVLGIALGWLIWGWRSGGQIAPGDARMQADLDAGRSELARLRNELSVRDAAVRDAQSRADTAEAELAARGEVAAGGAGAAAAFALAQPGADASARLGADPEGLRVIREDLERTRSRAAQAEAALREQRGVVGRQARDGAKTEADAADLRAQLAALGAGAAGAGAGGALGATAPEQRIAELEDALVDARRRAEENAAADSGRAEALAKLESAETALAEERRTSADLAAKLGAAGMAAGTVGGAAASGDAADGADLSETAALRGRVTELEDALADARRRAEENDSAEARRAAALGDLEAAKAKYDAEKAHHSETVARLEAELGALKQAGADAGRSDAGGGSTGAAPQAFVAGAPAGEASGAAAGPGSGEGAAPLDPDAVGDRPTLLDAPGDGGADDLKKIKGVGPKLEELLHDLGVYHFEQIASWTDREVAWVDARLRFPGRIARDQWIEQAQKLAGGGATEFSERVEKDDIYKA